MNLAHVLLVDDLEENRKSLAYALGQKNKGWRISTAADFAEAKAVIDGAEEPIDVVLTDLILDEAEGKNAPADGGRAPTGIDILDYAKRRDPLAMVIVFTAREQQLDRFEAYRQGAFDCVEKNMLGKIAWREISAKANAAIHFRRLAQEQAQGVELLTSLRRFFDPQLLHFMSRDASRLAVRERPVTLAFWDIRGFSDLCHTLRDETDLLQGFLMDYRGALQGLVRHHGGIVDKVMGDTVMALFLDLTRSTAPGAQAPSARPAVEAARRARETFPQIVRKWRHQWSDDGAPEPSLVCAIHTGECLVGIQGTEEREEFTAVGRHVNFVAQLRKMAKPGQILVTEAANVGLDGFTLESLGRVSNPKSLPDQKISVFEVK